MSKFLLIALVVGCSLAPAARAAQPGELYPDLIKAFGHIDSEGPRVFEALVQNSSRECARFINPSLPLVEFVERASRLLGRLRGRCLLPVLAAKRAELVRLLIDAQQSPLEFAGRFNPVSLATGWWNPKFFQDGLVDPAETLLNWVVIDEAIRRALLETRLGPSQPYAPYNAIFLPMVLASRAGDAKALQIRTFLANARCAPQAIACRVMQAKLVAAYNAAIATQKDRLTADLEAVRNPVRGAVDHTDVAQITQTLVANRFLAQLRAQPGSAAEWLRALLARGLFVNPARAYRDLLFDLGAVPKELANETLARALHAALILSELEDALVVEVPDQRRADVRLAMAELPVDAGKVHSLVVGSVKDLLAILETLLNLKWNGMVNP